MWMQLLLPLMGARGRQALPPMRIRPYAFIMEAEGKLIVHPTLAGKDLKVEGMPIYEAIKAATPQGEWVKYVWKEKEKNTYIKRTNSNLIVGSGY